MYILLRHKNETKPAYRISMRRRPVNTYQIDKNLEFQSKKLINSSVVQNKNPKWKTNVNGRFLEMKTIK